MRRNGEKRLKAMRRGSPQSVPTLSESRRRVRPARPNQGQGAGGSVESAEAPNDEGGTEPVLNAGLIDEVAYLAGIIAVQTEIGKVGLDIDEVMALVAVRSQTLTGANGAVVELVGGDEMFYRAGSGVAAGFLGARIPAASSLSGLCVRTGQVFHSEETLTDARVNRELCRRVGVRSVIAVPLVHGGRPVGVLKVFSLTPGKFDDRDVRSLQLMAGLIGSAMGHAAEHQARLQLLDERTKAMEALRQSEERLTEQLELTRRLNADLERANRQLAEIARTDGLTGLKNRRYFDEALLDGCALMSRRGEPVSVILVDVDDFKRHNDSYGHHAGDEVLRTVAAALQASARAHDTVARFGGEEFALLLLGADSADAIAAAERLRLAVEAGPWPVRPVTASFGVATSRPGCTDCLALVKQADEALYISKRQGRNRVTCYGDAAAAFETH